MRRGHLLDASALLALLFREPGAEEVVKLIESNELKEYGIRDILWINMIINSRALAGLLFCVISDLEAS